MATVEITVKTLDSQNHKFDVADELTVKQFKENIADTVSVTAESQRLIYCGRVLQDDKKLSEYGLDKKVVHLVQKTPPSQRPPPSSGGASTARSGQGTGRTGSRYNVPGGRMDNSMYLGALSFPPEFFPPQNPEMMHGAASSRSSVIRSMLQRADNIISRLENPNAQAPTQASNATSTTSESTPPPAEGEARPARGEAEGAPMETEGNFQGFTDHHHGPEALSGAISAAIAGALSAVVSAVGTTMTPSNITVMQPRFVSTPHTCPHQPPASGRATPQGGTDNGGGGQSATSTPTHPPMSSSASPASNPQGEQQGSTTNNNNNSGSPGDRPRPMLVPLNSLADSLEELDRLQMRFRPHVRRVVDLLRSDPTLEPNSTDFTEARRNFMLVSETMHFLSHAYHSLSDLYVNFSRNPPRRVSVRQIMVQSAPSFFPPGFPISAQINVMTTRASPTTTTSTSSATPSSATASSTPAAPSTNANTSSVPAGSATNASAPPPTPAPAPTSATNQPNSGPQPMPRASRFPFEGLPFGSNLEVVMDLSPVAFTFEEANIAPPAGNTADGEPGGAEAQGVGGIAPQDFVYNLMQTLASQMGGAAGAHVSFERAPGPPASGPPPTSATSTTSSSSTSAGPTTVPSGATATSGGIPVSPQTTAGQARVNTTTSTHTRATTRPHMHISPFPMPAPAQFDPFLPCTSHHIVSTLRLPRAPQPTMSATTAPTTQGQPPRGVSVIHASPFRMPAGGPNILNILRQMFGESEQSGSTIADFLNTMPEYTYTQGESLFADLFVTMARHFTFRDLFGLTMRQSTPLNRLQTPLRTFLNEQLLNGEGETSESTSRVVDRLMQEVRPYLEVVQTSQLRDDVNFEATLRQFFNNRIPMFIRLIFREDMESNAFGSALMGISGHFVHDLATLTLMCCHGGRQGLERILHRYVQVLSSDLDPTIQQWTAANSRLPVRNFVQGLPPNHPSLETFLVRTQTGAPVPAAAPPVTPPPTPTLAPVISPTPDSGTDQEEAMECEDEFVLALEGPSSDEDVPVLPLTAPTGPPVLPLPPLVPTSGVEVVIEAENWHNGVDQDWVPVISQDIQRQRRQSDQGPFSDAYLSSMSSKRRKLIASSKPQGTVGQVIAESVSHAASAVGVAGAEQLGREAGADPGLQSAYKEEVKKAVGSQLTSNPDFNPERYPNASQYFNPGK